MVSRLELGLVVGVGVDADADADAGVNVILGILTRADGIALVVVTELKKSELELTVLQGFLVHVSSFWELLERWWLENLDKK